MPAGRPTEYREEFVAKVDEYLSQCQDVEEDYHKTRGDKSDSYDRLVRVNLPTVEGFAKFLGVSRRSIFEWRDSIPEFSHSLDKILAEQQKRLIDKGLSGDYNPVIAKLILSSNHGMKERVDQTTNDKDLPTPLLNALPDNKRD